MHPTLSTVLKKAGQFGLHGWILAAIAAAATLAPLLAPHDPLAVDVIHRLQPPSWTYPLGTDALGRCLLSRLLFGARVSLGVVLGILAISFVTGTFIGGVAGYAGGLTDSLLMRLTDLFMAMPSLVVTMVLARSLGPGPVNLIWILSLGMWPGYARMVRGMVMQAKEEHHIEVAVMAGLSRLDILGRHILPSITGPLVVMATLGMGRNLLMTSALGFLGLGIIDPTPEWGAMLNNGATWIRSAPHLALFPGLAISVTVLAFNGLGEKLEGTKP